MTDANGNLFGNAVYGGPYTCDPDFQGCGLIFELSPHNGQWIYSVIYFFGPGPGNGYLPMGQLLLGPGGVLYGITSAGGAQRRHCIPTDSFRRQSFSYRQRPLDDDPHP